MVKQIVRDIFFLGQPSERDCEKKSVNKILL